MEKSLVFFSEDNRAYIESLIGNKSEQVKLYLQSSYSDYSVVELSSCRQCRSDDVLSPKTVKAEGTPATEYFGSFELKGNDFSGEICVYQRGFQKLCVPDFLFFGVKKWLSQEKLEGSYLGIGRFGSPYSLVYQLKQLQKIDSLVLGIFIGSVQQENSELSFGKPDLSKVQGEQNADIVYFKAANDQNWSLNTTNLKIGNSSFVQTNQAVLKIENQKISFPRKSLDSLIKQLKSLSVQLHQQPNDVGLITSLYWNNKCDAIKGVIPDISFNFEGQYSFILASETLLKNQTRNDYCELQIDQTQNSYYELGLPFFHNFYVVLDEDNKQIGLAVSSNSEAHVVSTRHSVVTLAVIISMGIVLVVFLCIFVVCCYKYSKRSKRDETPKRLKTPKTPKRAKTPVCSLKTSEDSYRYNLLKHRQAENQARELREAREDLTRRRESRGASPCSDPVKPSKEEKTKESLTKLSTRLKAKQSQVVGGNTGYSEVLADLKF